MSEQGVVFALSWGRRWTSPGLANRAIADRVARLVGKRRSEFLLFAQWEVGLALREKEIACDHEVFLPTSAFHISTRFVLSQMCEEVRRGGFYREFRFFLVSHPVHSDRCREILLALGVPGRNLITLECEDIYDPADIHPWVWTKELALLHESTQRLISRLTERP